MTIRKQKGKTPLPVFFSAVNHHIIYLLFDSSTFQFPHTCLFPLLSGTLLEHLDLRSHPPQLEFNWVAWVANSPLKLPCPFKFQVSTPSAPFDNGEETQCAASV